MPTVFTKIIDGELPARFVWKDERCVAFLATAPLKPGHALVVPIEEVDHWLDLEPELTAHLTMAAQAIGKAVQRAFNPVKVGLMIAGLEVPHVHLHVVPIRGLQDMDFARADRDPDAGEMERAADAIRAALRALRYAEVSD